MSAPPREELPYAACYCEENVWHLADAAWLPAGPRHVVFVSNAAYACPLWAQRAGDPVVWDYHVFLVAGGLVFDLDTTAGFPVPLDAYLEATFRPQGVSPPRFRVVAADVFRARFASDRSHMRDAPVPPPPWPCIGPAEGDTMNLPRFVDVTRPFVGELCDLEGLRARFDSGVPA